MKRKNKDSVSYEKLKQTAKYFIFRWKLTRTHWSPIVKRQLKSSLIPILFCHSDNHRVKLADFSIEFFSRNALEYLFREIFIEECYLFEMDSENPLIIDCGSNIGMSVINFKLLYPKSTIIAFEPDSLTYEIFKNNIQINKISNVEIINAALSTYDGTIRFYLDHNEEGSLLMSTKKERKWNDSTQVNCVRLSGFINRTVDLLKMDVEGSEMEIISDLVISNKLEQVNKLVIEYHHHLDESVDSLSELLAVFEENDFGYQLSCKTDKPVLANSYQDIMIYAYKKNIHYYTQINQ